LENKILPVSPCRKRSSLPIWAVESEVNNGGLSQYFLISSGESASFVVEALELLAPLHFPSGLLRSAEEIRSAAADFPDHVLEKLEPLDQEFFSYPHDLTDLLFACIRASAGVWTIT
jgi:hypothetical protein